MRRYGKEEAKQNPPQRAPYSPPRLAEYGSLAQLVRVKGGGIAHDPSGCLNTKTSSPT